MKTRNAANHQRLPKYVRNVVWIGYRRSRHTTRVVRVVAVSVRLDKGLAGVTHKYECVFASRRIASHLIVDLTKSLFSERDCDKPTASQLERRKKKVNVAEPYMDDSSPSAVFQTELRTRSSSSI